MVLGLDRHRVKGQTDLRTSGSKLGNTHGHGAGYEWPNPLLRNGIGLLVPAKTPEPAC